MYFYIYEICWCNLPQKQLLRSVFIKRCSENMQQIYRWIPMPKCDFNKVAFNFIDIALLHGWWWWWWWWGWLWIIFVVWLTDERHSFPGLISSRDHCHRSSPSRISDTPRAGFEPAQNLSSGLVEWSCAVVITTTPRVCS